MSRAKKTAKERVKKGAAFEERVARWLKQAFNFEDVRLRELVRGKISKRPYEVDIHAVKTVKRFLGKRPVDVWVECKTTRVRRADVVKLVESARDVRAACESGIEEWYPDMLVIVSEKGFDVDAIMRANESKIYCILAKPRRYEFVGDLKREDFEACVASEY